jgi:uncharacterized membrane protein
MSKKFIYNYLSEEQLNSISAKIKEIEKATSAELVITIKEKRGWLEKHKSITELAEKEFINAGIGKTKSGTGILFFLIFNAREFCILADKAIDDKVQQSVWDSMSKELVNNFKQEKYFDGIISVIDNAGKILSHYFPITDSDKNELPDKVRIE